MKRLIRIEWLKNYSYFPVILFSSIYFILVIGFIASLSLLFQFSNGCDTIKCSVRLAVSASGTECKGLDGGKCSDDA